jgi:hypothetical protein
LDKFPVSVGMVVQARPVGGYQHSFFSDGSPQLWAFGEMLNYGSGSTANVEPFAYSPMSTNNVLINGIGQRHLCHWRMDHFAARRLPKQIARFAAYRELPEGGVYALADLTNGFRPYAGPAGHWWGDLAGPYQRGPLPKVERALRHLLFLHGHLHDRGHRRWQGEGGGTVHHVGATSASLLHEHPDRTAGYNVYELDAGGLGRVFARVYDDATGAFREEEITQKSASHAD